MSDSRIDPLRVRSVQQLDQSWAAIRKQEAVLRVARDRSRPGTLERLVLSTVILELALRDVEAAEPTQDKD